MPIDVAARLRFFFRGLRVDDDEREVPAGRVPAWLCRRGRASAREPVWIDRYVLPVRNDAEQAGGPDVELGHRIDCHVDPRRRTRHVCIDLEVKAPRPLLVEVCIKGLPAVTLRVRGRRRVVLSLRHLAITTRLKMDVVARDPDGLSVPRVRTAAGGDLVIHRVRFARHRWYLWADDVWTAFGSPAPPMPGPEADDLGPASPR